MKNIKSVVMPELGIWSKQGQIVELSKSDNCSMSGIIFSQERKNGKIYKVSIAFQLDTNTGIPYTAAIYAHRGGNCTRARMLCKVNLSKFTFLKTDRKKINFTNTGNIA